MRIASSGRLYQILTIAMSLLAAALIVVTSMPPRPSLPSNMVSPAQIIYFFEEGCDRCMSTAPLIAAYAARHADLPFAALDMAWLDTVEKRLAYDEACGVPEARRLEVPALFVHGRAYIGVDAIRELEAPSGGQRPPHSGWSGAAERYGPQLLRALTIVALVASAGAITGCRRRALLAVRNGLQLFLSGVLLVSSVSKVLGFVGVSGSLAQEWRVPRSWAAAVVCLAITLEILVAVTMLTSRPGRWARLGPPLLFGSFLAYTLCARLFSVSGDCGCFPWRESLGWTTVARDLGFLVLALTVFSLSDDRRRPDQ